LLKLFSYNLFDKIFSLQKPKSKLLLHNGKITYPYRLEVQALADVRWQLQETRWQLRPVALVTQSSDSAAPPGGAPVDRSDGRADPPFNKKLIFNNLANKFLPPEHQNTRYFQKIFD